MHFKNIVIRIILLFITLFVFGVIFTGCGEETEAPAITLSGTIHTDHDEEIIAGPVFVTVFKGDDLEKIYDTPEQTIKKIHTINENEFTYQIDLTDTNLKAGDNISVFAFADNDYQGSLPNLTTGDIVGFYFDKEEMTTSHMLRNGNNINIDIDVHREVFSFEKELHGKIKGDYSGEVVLIAYAGEINSLDFAEEISFEKIIGYKKFYKETTVSELDYALTILPFGYDLPIDDVYLITMYDNNGNGKPDEEEYIGYHTTAPSQLPTLVTVSDEPQTDMDIHMVMPITKSSNYNTPIKINNPDFNMPADYDTDSPPVFIFVAQTDDPETILTSPLTTIKYFKKLPAPTSELSIDLSATDLTAGDEIMLFTMQDADYVHGFPDPTPGDYIGYYINTTDFSFTVTLSEEESQNTLSISDDTSFSMNKKIYAHDLSLQVSLQNGRNRSILKTGDQVIIIIAQKAGVDDKGNTSNRSYMVTDMDYIIGMKKVDYSENNRYTVDIFPFLLEEIVKENPFTVNDAYIFAFLDENKNSKPDDGEPMGYYGDVPWWSLGTLIPKLINIKSGNASSSGYTVKFVGRDFERQ